MGLLGDIGGDLGAIGGALSGGGADDAASKFYQSLVNREGAVNPNITAQQAGPSALGAAGGGGKAAQLEALRQLQNTYNSGGLDANTRAGLAEATTATNNAAQARSNAVAEHARAIGGGRGGVGLALQAQAGQAGDQNANQQAMNAAAVAQGNRQGAMTAAGSLGGAIRGQDYQAAGSQDAINQFNAQMRQNASQQTFSNTMNQMGQQGKSYSGAYDAQKDNEARVARLYGSIGKTVGEVGDAAVGVPKGTGQFDDAGDAYAG